MNTKTVSCHYGAVYSIAHNNRVFIPKNVDSARSCNNYYCIAAGEAAILDIDDPRLSDELWKQYKELDKKLDKALQQIINIQMTVSILQDKLTKIHEELI